MATLHVAVSRLIEELQAARAESDRLFASLTSEGVYERPIAERHRILFYIGHLDAFDSIQICREALGIKSPDPELDRLFQAGIDPVPGQLPGDTPADWPSPARVQEYVARCRRRVDENLDLASDDIVSIALEHRQMHLETLAYMFHNLSYDLKHLPPSPAPATPSVPSKNEWRHIPAGEAILGKPRDNTFGWDNEYEETRVAVPSFSIQRYKVTNGDYLRFVQEGADIPNFWVRRGGDIFYRGMFEEIPLPLDWPVYVSQSEALAYANWLGRSLPTEAQFHRAAYGAPSGKNRPYPWGDAEPDSRFGNFDFRRWDPESVYAAPHGDSAFGVSQLVGNGWEWTGTEFASLPGFVPHETYPGYSANFFDGDHFVIKGGSPRTAARLLRPSFRNWFRRDYKYVYAGFRCVDNQTF